VLDVDYGHTLFNSTGKFKNYGFDAYGGGSRSRSPDRLGVFGTVEPPRIDNTPRSWPPPFPPLHECELYWCIRTFHNSSEDPEGSETTEMLNTYDSFLKMDDNHYPYVIFTVLNKETNHNETFVYDYWDHDAIGAFLTSLFTIPESGGGISTAILQGPGIEKLFSNIANSITNAIRNGPNSTNISGTTLREETYFKVRWPWLILPITLVVLSNGLLAFSIIDSKRHNIPIWKSSSFVMLFHGGEGDDRIHGNISALGKHEMQELANGVQL